MAVHGPVPLFKIDDNAFVNFVKDESDAPQNFQSTHWSRSTMGHSNVISVKNYQRILGGHRARWRGSSRGLVVRMHDLQTVSRWFKFQKSQRWWQEGHLTLIRSCALTKSPC